MLALGTALPPFTLPDVASGSAVSSDTFHDHAALVVIFLCAHCPYVHHVAPELARLEADYASRGVGIVGVTSNDIVGYPQDAPEPTARFAREQGWTFPLLFDETQEVARAFTAACTPDFFLFDAQRKLVYRGQLDGSRPSRGEGRPSAGTLDGSALRAALDAVLAGELVAGEQRASIGCSIKWKEA